MERARLRFEPGSLRLHAEHPQAFMHLDPPTRRSLGLDRDRQATADDLAGLIIHEAATPMGARELRRWLDQPLRDRERLEERLNRVSVVLDDPLARGRLQAELRGLPDLERITTRISQGFATPRDLRMLRNALTALPGVRRIAGKWPELAAPLPPPSLEEVGRVLADALLAELPATVKV